jgi:hypothetical protein
MLEKVRISLKKLNYVKKINMIFWKKCLKMLEEIRMWKKKLEYVRREMLEQS